VASMDLPSPSATVRRPKELEQENAKLKRPVSELSLGQAGAEGHRLGKLLNPERRRGAVEHARKAHGMSEPHACRVPKTVPLGLCQLIL